MSDVERSFYVRDDEYVVSVASVRAPWRSRDPDVPDDPGEIELDDMVKKMGRSHERDSESGSTYVSLQNFIVLWAEETGHDVREAARRLHDEMFDLAREDARERWDSRAREDD